MNDPNLEVASQANYQTISFSDPNESIDVSLNLRALTLTELESLAKNMLVRASKLKSVVITQEDELTLTREMLLDAIELASDIYTRPLTRLISPVLSCDALFAVAQLTFGPGADAIYIAAYLGELIRQIIHRGSDLPPVTIN